MTKTDGSRPPKPGDSDYHGPDCACLWCETARKSGILKPQGTAAGSGVRPSPAPVRVEITREPVEYEPPPPLPVKVVKRQDVRTSSIVIFDEQ